MDVTGGLASVSSLGGQGGRKFMSEEKGLRMTVSKRGFSQRGG